MVWVFLLVIVLGIIMVIGHAIAKLCTAICIIFAVLFWGSLAALAVSLVVGSINAIRLRDGNELGSAVGVGGSICLMGLMFAAVVFVVALVVDFFRFISFAPELGIEFSHLFFPWQRFGM